MTTTATDAAFRRAAQALVDACYEERVRLVDAGPWSKWNLDYVPMPMTLRRCLVCHPDYGTHRSDRECPVAELERLLRGAP